MKKLKLDLNTLRVESFETLTEPGQRGTMAGFASVQACVSQGDPNCNTGVSCAGTCEETCAKSCDTCLPTCEKTCDFWCPPDPL